MRNKLLIIDDEPQLLRLLSRMMELEGYTVLAASNRKIALQLAEEEQPQVVLCDVFLPDGNGVDMINELKKLLPYAEVILLTAHGNIIDGVQAIKNGAFDYITKGDDNNKIIPLISSAVCKAEKNKLLSISEFGEETTFSFENIIASSPAMQQTVVQACKVAATDVPVLLTGETGTGKEVFAQAIHNESLRNKKRFVAINCSTISKELLESELFGYKAGAFTGAQKDKKGLLEEADGGTLFLDEIGEMPFPLQSKLLRVLEDGSFIKVGATRLQKVNIRLIAATNRDLNDEIRKGNFRQDLFYRLSVFHIHLLPLRERQEDIEPLMNLFIQKFSPLFGHRNITVSPAFLRALMNHSWNGNIRELRNIIERSMIVCSENVLILENLPVEIQRANQQANESDFMDFDMATIERKHIIRMLEYTNGNKTEAARLMKIGLTTLYRKMEEYGIEK